MFGAGFFGKTFFGGTYFGPNLEVIVVVKPKGKGDPQIGTSAITRRTLVTKKKYLKDPDKILKQLIREDEELIRIIVQAIDSGIIK